MRFSEQLKEMTAALSDRISHIEDTTGLLPHTVFIEEVGDDGQPRYKHYRLIKILSDGKCQVQCPITLTVEERDLSEINIEWLITIWERHCELLPDDIDPELLYMANSGRWKDRAFDILEELGLGNYQINYDFVHVHWQNLRCDEENIEEYRQHLREIGREPVPNGSYEELSAKYDSVLADLEAYILRKLNENGGKIVLQVPEVDGDDESDDNPYPVIVTLYGKHGDNPNIAITEVYLKGSYIFANGEETSTGIHETGYLITHDQYNDIAYFISKVLEEKSL